MSQPIPVTLLTGFLGAGKTTLLEHVLGAGTGLRFAIIENEYGDVGIDGSVVNTQSGAVFELNDGCVCCTVRDDLIGAFEEIIARRDEFDHVIIETTGLAEPGPVMSIFERQALRDAVSLKSVLTVVDAHHVDASLEDVSTCAEQITYADLILLNKIDGVSPEHLEATETRLRALNPLAQVIRAERSRIDVEFMLTYDRGAAEVDGTSDPQSDHDHQHHDHHDHHGHHDHARDHHGHGHHDHHHHDHDHHEHDTTILSLVVEGDGDVNVDTLDIWLGDLARSHDPTLLRMKGILAVPDDPRRFIFNGVRQSVEVRPGRPWNNEPRFNRIVFIGRGLDQAALQSGLDACLLVTPEIGSPAR